MFNFGKVEKKIYSLREEHPLVIPQIDPDKISSDDAISTLKKLESMGVGHIAIGSSLSDPVVTQTLLDVIMKDFDFSVTTYISNTSSFLLKGKKGRAALYWATVFNANNTFFLKDSLIMGSPFINKDLLEPIPSAYVFDERGSKGTANWLAQPNSILREKPEISLATALACQYLGIRFYIMAGGSGSLLPPPESHVKLLSKKTELFLIPTSGIKALEDIRNLFDAGADAMHIGAALEGKDGLVKFQKMFDLSKKYCGKKFI